MLTKENLKAFGADVDAGLARCLNNEQFYFRMITKIVDDGNFDKLSESVKSNDKAAAFQAAHALKGVLGNLSLTPMYECASEMTELLRAGKDADYDSYTKKLLDLRDALKSMI